MIARSASVPHPISQVAGRFWALPCKQLDDHRIDAHRVAHLHRVQLRRAIACAKKAGFPRGGAGSAGKMCDRRAGYGFRLTTSISGDARSNFPGGALRWGSRDRQPPRPDGVLGGGPGSPLARPAEGMASPRGQISHPANELGFFAHGGASFRLLCL